MEMKHELPVLAGELVFGQLEGSKPGKEFRFEDLVLPANQMASFLVSLSVRA